MSSTLSEPLLLYWTEHDAEHSARWRSESGLTPPRRVVLADDRTPADEAYRAASQGTGLLWRGDFQNARQLLQALARRADRRPRKPAADLTTAFHQMRLAQSQRARLLAMVLIEVDPEYTIALRRAPDWRLACSEAWGAPDGQRQVCPLRELLGIVGAHEWRKKGVEVTALGARVHAHYGVFAPTRQEYVALAMQAPLPAAAQTSDALAIDLGTGTGVLAAVLAKRGLAHVIATDLDPRALACARENIDRLGLAAQVELLQADLYPPTPAALVICNPPWVPARPSSTLERAVYDPDSAMLRGFLDGLAAHLRPGGEGWLILSDLAEHLGLRTREQLLGWIEAAGLRVLGRLDRRPVHPRTADADDPLHAARKAEITSLWRLGRADDDASPT